MRGWEDVAKEKHHRSPATTLVMVEIHSRKMHG
jgi:hypothetical protein